MCKSSNLNPSHKYSKTDYYKTTKRRFYFKRDLPPYTHKNIKVKIMHFGGMLTMEYGIALVYQFYPSPQESKKFYSLNTALFFCYIFFQKQFYFSQNYRKE
jgi:hypothetical protein